MRFFLLTMAVVFGLAASMPPVSHSFLSVVLVLSFGICIFISMRKKEKIAAVYALEACIFSGFLLYVVLKSEFAPFYHLISNTAGGASSTVGRLIGRPISMGTTYSGIDVAVFFLIAFTVAVLFFKRITFKKYLFHVAFVIFIWIFYIGLWSFLAESSLTLRLNLLEPLTGPLDYRAVLFVLLSIQFLYVCRDPDNGDGNGRPLKKAVFSTAAILTACAAIASAPIILTQAPLEGGGGRIVFLDMETDFSVPSHGNYGLDSAGMFGVLPHYLKLKGYDCLIAKAPDARELAQADVLAIFNPMYSLSENELKTVWRFVEDGGAVLAVGDHTGHEQIRLPFDAILEPVGVSFNFDSALPFKSLWAEEFRLRKSPVFKGVSSRQIQIVVGASLNVGYRAKPLVIGKEGFSDAGDLNNERDGYLGNMRFNRGERIGDLILAAEAAYGDGKFMVFGDTTHFQNIVIPYSYPFIDRIFAYLADGEKHPSGTGEKDNIFKATCIIDASHLEVFARDKSENAPDGLIACAMRSGFMPFLNQNENLSDMLKERNDVKLLVLIEPAKHFSAKEQEELLQFMESGGTIILCAGYDSPKASLALAGHFGFTFENMPIGRVAPDKDQKMAFWNACPVLYRGGVPGGSSGDGSVRSVMEIWGNSTIAYKAIGAGGIYVFGDPDFLMNKNIEGVAAYREGNIMFLDNIFKEILEGVNT